MTRRILFLLLSPSLLWAQVPTQFPSGTIQNSNEISLYSSSVDNLVNSQQGEFVASTISQDLAAEASQSYQGCEDPNAANDPDCLMSGALLGMKELTDESAASFNQQGDVAQSNVCVFSSNICGADLANPYFSLSPQPALTAAEVEELLQNLNSRGLSIAPRTGIVSSGGVPIINPASEDSLKKGLGQNLTSRFVSTLKKLENRAVQLASKLSKAQVIKKLNLLQILPGASLAGVKPQFNDSARADLEPQTQRSVASVRKPEQNVFEGMTTSYRGEPMGVRRDSLFRIVKSRYFLKAKENSFLPAQ